MQHGPRGHRMIHSALDCNVRPPLPRYAGDTNQGGMCPYLSGVETALRFTMPGRVRPLCLCRFPDLHGELFSERPEGGFELVEPRRVTQVHKAIDLGHVTVEETRQRGFSHAGRAHGLV